MRKEVLDHIRCLTYHKREEFDTDINIINSPNGLYHIDSGEIEKHHSTHLSRKQNPIPHIPGAKPKLFGKFLSEIINPRDVRTLVELMAYSFYRANPHEIITYLHGFGSNGKSVLFNLLTALHCRDNVSHMSLTMILERPFALRELV